MAVGHTTSTVEIGVCSGRTGWGRRPSCSLPESYEENFHDEGTIVNDKMGLLGLLRKAGGEGDYKYVASRFHTAHHLLAEWEKQRGAVATLADHLSPMSPPR